MASRLNHERVNRASKVTASQRDFVTLHAPAAKTTGITCPGCGMDLAHFGSRPRFKAHLNQCPAFAAAA
jgi:hypothetical protein